MSIQNFLKLFSTTYPDSDSALFRLTGHFEVTSNSKLPAAFHREQRSIYMDLNRVSRSEWFIILIHELTHSLDDELYNSVEFFSNAENVNHIVQLSQKTSDHRMLDKTDQEFLRKWLEAGLGRGLWAEYRAWLVSFKIYQDGLREGLWQNIPWMDHMLSLKPANMDLARYIYLYLDQRFFDPTELIFKNQLLQTSLKDLRQYYRNAQPPPIGTSLSALVR